MARSGHLNLKLLERAYMNKDQIKGGMKEVAGMAQRKTGEIIGNPNQQDKGALKEAEGKIQKKLGDVEQAVKVVSRKP